MDIEYLYDAYGNITDQTAGTLASANPYRYCAFANVDDFQSEGRDIGIDYFESVKRYYYGKE